MLKNNFTGSWKLLSLESHSSEGDIYYPYGKNVSGILIYDSAGNMSVQLTRADRSSFVSDSPQTGSPEETQDDFDGYIAYFGTYEVKEEGVMLHHVTGSLFPNWTGSVQKRFYNLSDNILTLRAPSIQMNNIPDISVRPAKAGVFSGS